MKILSSFLLGALGVFLAPFASVGAEVPSDPFGKGPSKSLGERDAEVEITKMGFGSELQVSFRILEMSFADFNLLKNEVLEAAVLPDLKSLSDLDGSMKNTGDLFSNLMDLDHTEFLEKASQMGSVTQIAFATMNLDYQKKAVFRDPMKIVYPTSFEKDPVSPEGVVPGDFQSRTLGLSLSLTAEALKHEGVSLTGEYDFAKFVDVIYYPTDKNRFSKKVPQPVFEAHSSPIHVKVKQDQTALVFFYPLHAMFTSSSPETEKEMAVSKSKLQLGLLSIKQL
ncbi:hypothetical protein P0Y35_01180 [Kiritimatiellaeota bacterium B1221]|nr:hypothetical protein [Kiritimatiellaeota bacterium B1221]